MSKSDSRRHDRFFRATFSVPAVAQEYIEYFLPKELSQSLDPSTLHLQKESFLDEDMKEHLADVVYRCGSSKKEWEFTLLFEHKSYPPRFLWLQLLRYQANAYYSQTLEPGFQKKFRPVLLVVIYHGPKKWKEREIEGDFDGLNDLVRGLLPRVRFILSDLNNYSEEDLLQKGDLLRSLTLSMKLSREESVVKKLDLILEGMDPEKSASNETVKYLYRQVLLYLRAGVTNKNNFMSAIKKLNQSKQEKFVSIYELMFQDVEADAIKKGRQEGIREGLGKGIEQGIEQGMAVGKMKGKTEGSLEKAFEVFRRGLEAGLELSLVTELTGISPQQAQAWKAMLDRDPGAKWKAEDLG